MRIALCISGHLRNYIKITDIFSKNILKPLKRMGDVDVFLSTWDTYNPVSSWAAQKYHPELCSKKVDVREMIDIYNPKSYLVENYEKIKNKFLLKNFSDKLPPVGALYYYEGILTTIPMWWRIYCCNMLKTKEEDQNNFKYDIVVRARPDWYSKTEFRFEKAPIKGVIYLPNVTEDLAGDYFALGDSEAMDKYSNLFFYLNEVLSNNFDFGGERMLRFYLKIPGISFSEEGANLDFEAHYG